MFLYIDSKVLSAFCKAIPKIYRWVDLTCLATQLGMRLEFWLSDSASAYSAFAFQKKFSRAAETVEGILI